MDGQFSGTTPNIATPQRKSEFKMAVDKTGSTYISACGGASNAISKHNTL